MVAVDHKEGRGKQKCADRAGGDPVNFPGLGGRAVFQPRHDKRGRKCKTRNDMEQCAVNASMWSGSAPAHVQSTPIAVAVTASHRQSRMRASAKAAAMTTAR